MTNFKDSIARRLPMTSVVHRHARAALPLLGAISLVLLAAPVGAIAAAAIPGHAVAGFGFWEALGCVGCISGFVIGGGLTVAGLAAFLAANPELGIYCVSVCITAAS